MLPAPPTDASPAIVKLSSWFQTSAGLYVRQWEQQRLDALVEDAFGFVAVQVGLPDFPALRQNRIPFKVYLGATPPTPGKESGWSAAIHASPEAIPLASQSVDLLILPHALEYADDPHAVLREAERVLAPEGRLIIAGFNPLSLWGARHRLGRSDWLPETGRLISLPRLKDWLKLLSFELDRGHFGCYALPISQTRWLERSGAILDKAGDRWWPVAGAVYLVAAVKRTQGLTLIGPSWKRRRRRTAHAEVAIQRQPSDSRRSSFSDLPHD